MKFGELPVWFKVLQYVYVNDGCSSSDIYKVIDLSPGYIVKNLELLKRNDMISVKLVGRTNVIKLTSHGRMRMEQPIWAFTELPKK